MPPRTLLLGARSQLGHDILRTWPEGSVTPLGHDRCDVTDPAAVRAAIAAVHPDLVVSLAASHRVDEVEGDPAEALRVNAYGAWLVAREAAAAGAAVMWVSTDYVFAGDAGRPYTEEDVTGPVNAYGASKAAGERLIALANPRHTIVRSSGLYGVAGASGKGGNFVETMLRLAREGRPLRVVHDQVLGPTSTHDLARAMAALAGAELYGIVHATNQGAISWHDFAARIFELCNVAADLAPVASAEYGAPARRPACSVLANTRLAAAGLPSLPPIEDALRRYLAEKGHLS
jgi:dTDP-4-dehydrorhamnose reductase